MQLQLLGGLGEIIVYVITGFIVCATCVVAQTRPADIETSIYIESGTNPSVHSLEICFWYKYAPESTNHNG